MIIQSNTMHTNARRTYRSSETSITNTTRWDNSGATIFSMHDAQSRQESIYTESHNGQKDTGNGNASMNANEDSKGDTMDDLMQRFLSTPNVHRNNLQSNISSIQKIRQQAIDYLLYILFGSRYDESNPTTDTSDTTSFSDTLASASNDANSLTGEGGQTYQYFYYSEQETTCFDTQGIVRTADGWEISFNLSLEMSRSFTQMSESVVDFGKPRLCDPLVINLDSNIANVSDQKFYFDIDADGSDDSISMLNSGSGYLALDRNGDGIINDGSELFGTQSGNGFADLAAYDKDENGWIDEADEIFQKLRIWTKDENGNDKLLTLSEAGVGAIYLGYENTDFALNNLTDNQTNAQIRKSGVFLYENGNAGTVQQLDLAT